MEPLHRLWEQHADRVEFVVVYVREAHPEDGWVVSMNREQNIRFQDPTSNKERHELAATCALRLQIRIPVLVDDIDDNIASAYGALPDRLYLVGRGGKIVYQGAPGPWGFNPEELARAIEALT